MATFKNVYKGGDGYSPVRLLVKNETSQALYYNLKGVTDAFGEQMQPYGHQTSLFGTYQRHKLGLNEDAAERDLLLKTFSKNPYVGFLKLAYYGTKFAMATYKGHEGQKIAEAMKVEAYATNYRSGFVKENSKLIIELGSIPVDGRLMCASPVARERALVGCVPLYERERGDFARAQIAAILERMDTDWLRRLELDLLARCPREFDPQVVQAKLVALDELLADLEGLGDVSAGRLTAERVVRHALERILTQLVEKPSPSTPTSARRSSDVPRPITGIRSSSRPTRAPSLVTSLPGSHRRPVCATSSCTTTATSTSRAWRTPCRWR